MLRVGEWCVNPSAGQILRNGETVRVEERTMRLLLCLAERAGEVVSIDDLLSQVWSDVSVSPDSVYQAVASLRRVLGDDPKQPTYIATVPRLGYRMVATVGPWKDPRLSQTEPNNTEPGSGESLNPATVRRPRRVVVMAAVALCLGVVLVAVFHSRDEGSNKRELATPAPQQKSIAVLPFLDLTEGMKEEEFADGMTEELIDKLSKVPGLQVLPPTSSFYFKGKQESIGDVARSLGVAYVLDGSVRKAGPRLRVAARLIRADSGYVVWSETYDRPFGDILMVQDDIAGEVTKALKASIEARPSR
jgi:TolB-like protein/DNA-binding winged helix-turn-helix (wHTH) protein